MNCFNFIIFNQKFQCNGLPNRIWDLTKRHWKALSTSSINNCKENTLTPSHIKSSYLSSAKSKSKNTEEIILQIVSQLEAKSSFFKRVKEAVADLQRIYPEADVVVFGSAASNLAFAKSDVDLFMDLKDEHRSPHEIIWRVRKTLLKSRLFLSAEAINATVPIVKCRHRNLISCDISFSSGICIYDSQLIKFLLSTDDRLRPLMLILKYLLKRENIVVNNHSLMVMIMFFLQTLDNPLIPPISYLQSKARKRTMLEGWDVSFSNDISGWQEVKNNLTVIELLHKFFKFYSTFEFGLNVISVFTANSYLKPVFTDESLLPAEYDLYKKKVSQDESFRFNCNYFMCIQGVFNHSANISRNFSAYHVNRFQKYCKTFAVIGDELLHKNSSEEDRIQFLNKLFKEDDQTDRGGKVIGGYMGTSDREVLFTMNNVCLDDSHLSADELRNKWWNSEFDNIAEVIRDVLKCEISITSGKPESKSDNVVEQKIISCDMLYGDHILRMRGEVVKEIDCPEDMPLIEKEKMITEHIVGKLEKSTTPFQFDVVCLFEKRPTCVRLKLEPKVLDKKAENYLLYISAVFKKRLPLWLSSRQILPSRQILSSRQREAKFQS